MRDGVIDSHTHRYPDEVIADPLGWAAERGEKHWAALVDPSGIQGWASREQMLADMDAAGIDKAVILGWYWENQDTCDEANRWHARWAAEDPDRFICFATVQPKAGWRAVKAIEAAIAEGWCRGVGEILPALQGFSLDDPAWLDICRICQEQGLPITLHATEPVGHAYEGRIDTPLMDYVRLAERFPRLQIILAHWGGGLPFFELNPWCQRLLKNVYYDTAASPLLYDRRIWKTVIDIVGPQKVLFGSDYPLRIYRRQPPGFARLVDEAAQSPVPPDHLPWILNLNAKRVLSLKA